MTLKQPNALGIMSRSATLDHVRWGIMKKQSKELENYVVLHDDRFSIPTLPKENFMNVFK